MRSPSEVAHSVYASIIATELGFCSHPMISMHVACMIETCFTLLISHQVFYAECSDAGQTLLASYSYLTD